jgi:SAM-dependent methyltransferase
MGIEQSRATWEDLGARDPLFTVLTIKRFKNNRWDPHDFFETGRREIDAVFAYLRDQGLEVARERALDFGCGVGRLTLALAHRFEQVVGIDIAESMLTAARRYNCFGDRCQYVLNTTNDLSQFEEDSFDFVYSNITLQHIPPAYSVNYVAEFFRVLRPGGLVVFQLPAGRSGGDGSLYGQWRIFRQRYLGPVRIWFKQLRGLSVVRTYGVPRETVEQVVQGCSGRLLDVARDGSTGNGWQGYRYCATKPTRRAA